MERLNQAKSAVLALLMLTASGAVAQVPKLINYQALLTDQTTGQPVVDAILDGATKFLGIKVGASPELTPRGQIVSVAYAIASDEADKLDGKDAVEFADAVHSHDDQYFTESELSTSDGNPPNTGSNQVNWANLTGVPSGFADGTDDGGAGGDNHSLDAADGSPVDVLFVNNDGNVGIFTTSAVDPLQVGSLGINGSGARATISDRGSLDRLGFAVSLASIRIGGKLVVGQTNLDAPEPNATLSVNGSVEVNGTVVHSSDVRWKKNVSSIEEALNKVMKLRGVEFDWRVADFPEMNFDNDTQIGLIAQEVEEVLPEVVKTDRAGFKLVAYSNLTALLIEATKQQQSIIEKQEMETMSLRNNLTQANAEITGLKSRMAQFESSLEKLTTVIGSQDVAKVAMVQNDSE